MGLENVTGLMQAAAQQDGPKISPLAMLLAGTALKQQLAAQGDQAPMPTQFPTMPNSARAGQSPMGSEGDVAPMIKPVYGPPKPEPAPVPDVQRTQPVQAPTLTDAVMGVAPVSPREKQYNDTQAQLDANLKQQQELKAPNAADYQPRWWQRLGAGLATFGSGMTHNPVFAEMAQRNLTMPYDRAMGAYNAQRDSLKDQASLLDHIMGTNLTARREDREARLTDSKIALNEAKGNKYDNAIDPNTIEQGEDGKWYGMTYGGDRKEAKAPKAAPTKAPSNYEQTVIAWANEDDPAKKKKLQAALDEMRKTEIKKFAAGSNRTPSELEIWMKAFEHDNGRAPSADEIAGRGKNGASAIPTFRDPESVSKWSDKWYADKRKEVRLEKDSAFRRNGNAKDAQPEYTEIEAQYKRDADEHERQKAEIYSQLAQGKNKGKTPTPATAPQNQQPPSVVTTDKPPKPGMVLMKHPDGTPGWVKLADVPKAKKAGYKQVSGK